MSRYTLSINIKSDNRDLLDNLMVTLETINGNLSDVDAVELLAIDETGIPRETQPVLSDASTIQRNLFLESWLL